MKHTPPIITLLTDFGENDSYVGAMKGVLLSILPDARLIDISHQVDPQDVQQAAGIVSAVHKYYPPHTVHLIVVDPGVGTTRRPVAVETDRGRFVAPDNGVLTHVLRKAHSWKAVVLENPEYWLPEPSQTFHGRDIFSPVAAHLAAGISLSDLGPAIDDLETIQIPPLAKVPGGVKGEVVRIDHFGNVLTNIQSLTWVDSTTLEFKPPDERLTLPDPISFAASAARITFSWRTLDGIRRTYGETPTGDTLALVGSSSELEVSVNQGNAADKLAIQVGDPVTLLFGNGPE
jgi:S-adenosylmethionine hydrolase